MTSSNNSARRLEGALEEFADDLETGRVEGDARTFLPQVPDAAALRQRLGLSQRRFAEALGISVGTLRNWEQGRREPEGPARSLLLIVDRHPEVLDTLRSGNEGEDAPEGGSFPADDLKMIKGIGPALERQLNELGVWRFEQIASFSESDIEWISENLGASADISSDDWIGQVRRMTG